MTASMVTAPQQVTLVSGGAAGSRPAAPLSRYSSLDAWRGFACIAVVFHHASGEMVLRRPELANFFLFKICQFGYLGVPIFFVISGYCIVNSACRGVTSRRGVWAFALSRMRRILPPYWFSALAYALLKVVLLILVAVGIGHLASLATDATLRGDFLYYFSNVTLTQYVFHRGVISPVFWTLCYEAAFYAIVACAMLAARRDKNRLLHILYAITLGCIVFAIAAPTVTVYPVDLWPQFGLGVLVYDLAVGAGAKALRPRVWGALISLGFLLQMALDRFSVTPLAGSGTFMASIVFAALIAILHDADPQFSENAVNWLFAKVGTFSYSLYLIHYFILALLLKLLAPALLTAHPIAILFFLVVIPIAIAPLFYLACERPFMNRRKLARPVPSGEVLEIPAGRLAR